MIESVTLQTSGRVIEQLDRPAILARLSDLPYGKRRACEEAARMGGNPDHYDEVYNIVVWLPFYHQRQLWRRSAVDDMPNHEI